MGRRYWIGTSGWVYRHWRGPFYPVGLKPSQWFEYYSRHFDTVELNNSFYRMPSENAWRGWAERAPHGFLFAVKASRFITHLKRLRPGAEPLLLLAGRAALLGEHGGPLLYQLPPNLARDDARLTEFLELLPPSHRHVVEFRHRSWFHEAVFDQLRRAGVGFCVFHMPQTETPRAVTADFAYVRLHGTDFLYSGRYSQEQLRDWAAWLAALPSDVSEAYVYFNNDAGAHAVENALTLRAILAEQGESGTP